MSLSAETLPRFQRMLRNLLSWLDEAQSFAQARDLDPEKLLEVRLYPDQFNLRRQIQSACDTAKLCGARLAGVDAPRHEDGEQTLAQLRERIGQVQAFLDQLDPAAVDAGATRVLTLPFAKDMVIDGVDYAREFALPNFYFHITTAYACLRHCGVKLGKTAFIGGMSFRPAG